jgi:hypothetical protein
MEPLDRIVIDLHPAIVEEDRETLPVSEGIPHGLGQRGLAGYLNGLGLDKDFQGFDRGPALHLTDRLALIGRSAVDGASIW